MKTMADGELCEQLPNNGVSLLLLIVPMSFQLLDELGWQKRLRSYKDGALKGSLSVAIRIPECKQLLV